MKKVVLLLASTLVLVLLVISCGGPSGPGTQGGTTIKPGTEYTPSSTGGGTGGQGIHDNPTGINTINIGVPEEKNWTGGTEADGLEFYLATKTLKSYDIVPVDGTLSAELYVQKSLFQGQGKGDLVQSWTGIQVSKADFDAKLGALVRLPYGDKRPTSQSVAILDVTFVTSDGQSLTTEVTQFIIGQ